MFALVLAMLFCVAIGAGVVGYVAIEARREGRGEFWTPEGQELINGARRTTGKVVARGEELGRVAAERTKGIAPRRDAAEQGGEHAVGRRPGAPRRPAVETSPAEDVDTDPGYRAAS